MLQVVSVFDLASGAFGRPVFVRALGEATRSFADEINRADQGNELYKHPEDFVLYHLGEFDDQSGVLVPREKEALMFGKSVSVRTDQS